MYEWSPNVTDRPAKPFYLDVLTRKHEAYPYDESESSIVEVEHQGRTIRLIASQYRLPASFRVGAIEGDVLCLIGKQLDFEEEDGSIIEGGDGVLVVALRVKDRDDTYAALVWHSLYDYTIEHLELMLGRTLWP